MSNSETGCTISSRVFITLVQWWNGQQTLWKECKTRTSKSWFRCDGAFAKLLTHFWLSDQGEVLKEIFRETTLWSHIRFNSVFLKLPLIYIRSVLKGLKRTIKGDQTNIFKTPCTPDDQLLNTFITKKPVTGSLVVFIREIFLYILRANREKGPQAILTDNNWSTLKLII